MDDSGRVREEFVQLAELGLAGKRGDVHSFLIQCARRHKAAAPEFSRRLADVINAQGAASATRAVTVPPVDQDSRLSLLRVTPPVRPSADLVLDPHVQETVNRIIHERESIGELVAHGLAPSRAVLFTGPPGVGKSLTASWIAHRLQLPLAVLDLSTVMSSYLGKTGQNIRQAFDYAKGNSCILFLDEMDAIAKRRDDDSDIGELKRLVTVLLQEVDDWPASGLLLAATNHDHLLDPALWRRFDEVIPFDRPSEHLMRRAIESYMGVEVEPWLMTALSVFLDGRSFGEAEKVVSRLRREAVLSSRDIPDVVQHYIRSTGERMRPKERARLGKHLMDGGLSQRQASQLSGSSRDTLRRSTTKTKEIDGDL